MEYLKKAITFARSALITTIETNPVLLFMNLMGFVSLVPSGSEEKALCDYCSREAISVRSVSSAGERALVALCLLHLQKGTPASYGVRGANGLAGYWRED